MYIFLGGANTRTPHLGNSTWSMRTGRFQICLKGPRGTLESGASNTQEKHVNSWFHFIYFFKSPNNFQAGECLSSEFREE